MPVRCDNCGLEAPDAQEVGQETLPFEPPKRYCAACRKRHQHQLYVVLMMVPVLCALGGLLSAWVLHTRWLDSIPFRLGLLVVFQWLMILPHELGHAVVARAFGFPQVRILVGTGRPIFSFKLLGTPVLFSFFPVGGVMLSQQTGVRARWKEFCMVVAGPLVNFVAVLVCLLTVPFSFLLERFDALISLFFWANLIVLVGSIAPYHMETAWGRLPSDGLLLWRLLFRSNGAAGAGPPRLRTWELALRHAIKWCGVAFMLAVTLLFLVIAAAPFTSNSRPGGWPEKLILPVVMLSLASLAGWITVRISKEPIRKLRADAAPNAGAINWSPQIESIQRINGLVVSEEFTEAVTALDELLASIPAQSTAAYAELLRVKLHCLVAQNEIMRAEQACLDFVNSGASEQQKAHILDSLASYIVYRLDSPHLELAERLARRALEITPAAPTVQGTLGGILVELGRPAEAEPLLQKCFDGSSALHDQGISSFYLGLIKLSRGQITEGKKLIDQGTILYAEPWLLAKAEARGVRRS